MSDEIIIESIKKMLGLKMPDDEIIASLVDAGVDYDYAKNMLDSVKNNKTTLKETKEKNKKDKVLFDNVVKVVRNNKQTSEKNDLEDVDKTSLGVWQEGILTIITQKLDEIDSKQRSLDEDIQTKVDKITSTELTKMKAIINSQRTLLISKVEMELASKLKDVKEQSASTLKLIQSVNANTQKKLEQMDSLVESMTDLKKTIQENLDVVQNMKESLNSTIMDFKSKVATELDELFAQYKTQIENITNKTNVTLNLAGKILESLVSASKKKIDDYLSTKLNGFMDDLESKLGVEDIKLALDKLRAIKDIDKNISNIVAMKVASAISSMSENNENKDIKDSIIDLNRRLMDLEKENRNKANVGLDGLKSRIDELEMYRKQSSNLIAKLLKEKKQKLEKLKQNMETKKTKQSDNRKQK